MRKLVVGDILISRKYPKNKFRCARLVRIVPEKGLFCYYITYGDEYEYFCSEGYINAEFEVVPNGNLSEALYV